MRFQSRSGLPSVPSSSVLTEFLLLLSRGAAGVSDSLSLQELGDDDRDGRMSNGEWYGGVDIFALLAPVAGGQGVIASISLVHVCLATDRLPVRAIVIFDGNLTTPYWGRVKRAVMCCSGGRWNAASCFAEYKPLFDDAARRRTKKSAPCVVGSSLM